MTPRPGLGTWEARRMKQGTSRVALEKDGTFHVQPSYARKGRGRVSCNLALFCLSNDVVHVSHCVYGAWNGENGRYMTFELDDVIE